MKKIIRNFAAMALGATVMLGLHAVEASATTTAEGCAKVEVSACTR